MCLYNLSDLEKSYICKSDKILNHINKWNWETGPKWKMASLTKANTNNLFDNLMFQSHRSVGVLAWLSMSSSVYSLYVDLLICRLVSTWFQKQVNSMLLSRGFVVSKLTSSTLRLRNSSAKLIKVFFQALQIPLLKMNFSKSGYSLLHYIALVWSPQSTSAFSRREWEMRNLSLQFTFKSLSSVKKQINKRSIFNCYKHRRYLPIQSGSLCNWEILINRWLAYICLSVWAYLS